MIIKINGKEYSFDGYVNPINSVQRLAENIYQQGKADERTKAIDECIEALKGYGMCDLADKITLLEQLKGAK